MAPIRVEIVGVDRYLALQERVRAWLAPQVAELEALRKRFASTYPRTRGE